MKSNNEKIAWIQLARSENVGPVTFRELLRYYETAVKALAAIPEMASRGGKRKISLCPYEVALKEYEQTLAFGGDIITSYEDEYPDLLRQIHDYPPVISVIGDKSLLNKQSIGIVGTRNATINGKQLAKKFAFDLADSGYIVTSGMALGIDRNAHEGALLKEGNNTIAVVGCGIDICYPDKNNDIYNEIKERGLIVSEFPLSSSPQAINFPRRNRIISGLSLGVLVIEAQKRSGSLITARLALEHNREVFAVPGSPIDGRSSGPNYLIKQGATLVESAGDIIEGLGNINKRRFILKEPDFEIADPKPKTFSDNEMAEARKIVLENFGANSITFDNIINETGLSYSLISMILLELELAGRIERRPGGMIALIME